MNDEAHEEQCIPTSRDYQVVILNHFVKCELKFCKTLLVRTQKRSCCSDLQSNMLPLSYVS